MKTNKLQIGDISRDKVNVKKRCCGSSGCRKLSDNTHIQCTVHKYEATPEQATVGARGDRL